MNKKKIEKITYDLVNSIIEETDLKTFDVEYVRESKNMFLRVYIDKSEGITIDDCTKLSRELNKKLDELDIIEEQYFLEVSSPGIDRPFKRNSDYDNNINSDVEVSLYKAIDGNKKLIGKLLNHDDNIITIESSGNIINIEKKSISKINKAITID